MYYVDCLTVVVVDCRVLYYDISTSICVPAVCVLNRRPFVSQDHARYRRSLLPVDNSSTESNEKDNSQLEANSSSSLRYRY